MSGCYPTFHALTSVGRKSFFSMLKLFVAILKFIFTLWFLIKQKPALVLHILVFLTSILLLFF